MKFTQQKTSTSVVFWIAFAVIAAALLITLLSVPAERPVGRASGCYGGDGIVENGYCCPPPWSKALCFPVENGDGGGCYGGDGIVENGYCCPPPWSKALCFPVENGDGGGVRPGPSDKSAGDVIIGVYDREGGVVRIPTEDGHWSTGVMTPEGFYADQPAKNFVVYSVEDDSSFGNRQTGEIPKEPKEPKQDNLAACVDHCIENWDGPDLFACRSGCDEKYGTGAGPRNGDGNGKGGDLGCDVMRRCPDGKNFYGQKDSGTGNCTTIDSCPAVGGGGDNGKGGEGGVICTQVIPPVPKCGFGEIATLYGQTDKECAKYVCEKKSLPPPPFIYDPYDPGDGGAIGICAPGLVYDPTTGQCKNQKLFFEGDLPGPRPPTPTFPPPIDECVPNAISLKCMWQIFETWIS